MERTALQKLVTWNNSHSRKPLIVWGARQVGKTYLVQNLFAETYYKNNYGYDHTQKLLTIPFYFIPFLAKDLASDGLMFP